jgi:hypothetical protein
MPAKNKAYFLNKSFEKKKKNFYVVLFFALATLQTSCGQSEHPESNSDLINIENSEDKIKNLVVEPEIEGMPSSFTEIKNEGLQDSSSINTIIKESKNPEIISAKKEALDVIVIGETLKTGMPLNEALTLLGTPNSVKVNRGTEIKMDSISINYPNQGIRVFTLTKKNTLEEIEVLPKFKGSLPNEIKIGSRFSDLVKAYGMPTFKDSSIVKYPERGMFLFLKNNALLSAKLFHKNSNLLEHKLLNR